MISEKNRQKILAVGIAGAVLFLVWDNWPESEPVMSTTNKVNTVVEAAPTVMPVQTYKERAKEEEKKLSDSDIKLRNLERKARTAQLEAIIAEAQSKKSKASSETEKTEAEIARIKADISNQEKLTRIQLMRAEAENNAIRNPLPMYQPSAINSQYQSEPKNVDVVKEKNVSLYQHPEVTATLNSVDSTGALITVEGSMQHVPVGGHLNGVQVLKIDRESSSVIVKNMASGKTRRLSINTHNSRGFASVKPLMKDESPSGGLANPRLIDIEPLPDHASME